MMIGAKDRTDYRTFSTKELIEEAKYYPSIELCVVLGERLNDAEREKTWSRCEACLEEFN